TIVPTPRHWQWQNGSTNFSQIKTIVLDSGTNKQDKFTAKQIQPTLSNLFNIKVDIKSGNSNSQNAIIIGDSSLIKNATWTAKMDAAGYVLKLDGQSVIIAGKSTKGRFYGAMSLNQLLESSNSSTLRNISISDYPS